MNSVKRLKIGYQGAEGSNANIAAQKLIKEFPDTKQIEFELIPLITSEQVVKALKNHEIDYGVFAIDNNISGVVGETKEALEGINYQILAEATQEIHHNLFKIPEIPMDDMTEVASHEQALKQCKNNLKIKFPRLKFDIISDTALGAIWLKTGKLSPETAIICPKEIGLEKGLELVAANIEDEPSFTHFCLCSII